MSREVVIIKWCDGTKHRGTLTQERAIFEHIITLDGYNAVQIDLCGTCEALIKELIEVLGAGAPAEPKPKSNRNNSGPKNFHCPTCNHTMRSESGLNQHIKKTHPEEFISGRS